MEENKISSYIWHFEVGGVSYSVGGETEKEAYGKINAMGGDERKPGNVKLVGAVEAAIMQPQSSQDETTNNIKILIDLLMDRVIPAINITTTDA